MVSLDISQYLYQETNVLLEDMTGPYGDYIVIGRYHSVYK